MMMTSSKLRRAFGTVALTAALSLLAAGPAQAARHDSDPASVRVTAAARGILQEVWSRLISMWESNSMMIDTNGGR